MTTRTKATGFYGTDSETYYVTPAGRVWIVASEDYLGTQDPVEIDGLPDTATPVDGLMTPDEKAENLGRIEKVSGESLIEG